MIDWLQSISAWASHVQGAGIPLSVADELTLETLAVRLRQSGTVIRDAETAAAWFGPVICRDADGQRQLMGILKAWEASLRVETPAPPSPIPQLDPVREELKVDSRWPRLWRLLMPILLLILSISMFSKDLWQGLGLQAPQPANPETPTRSWFQSYFPDSLLNAVFPTATGLVLAALFLFLIVKSWRSFRTATLLRGLAPRDVVACLRLKLWSPEHGRLVAYPPA